MCLNPRLTNKNHQFTKEQTMKKKLIITGLMLLAVVTAEATLSYSSPTTTGTLPDGSPVGMSSSITVSGADINIVRDVNVTLQISGGYNGDLYGYLVGPDGGMAVLLNRIGRTSTDAFGNSGAGMNVTLDDDLGSDIHLAASGVLSGVWMSDGRLVSPFTVTGTSSAAANLNDVFIQANSHVVNGTWTLFLADVSGGDINSLVSWGLDITVVPEPVTWAMIIFGSLVGVYASARRMRRQPAA